MSKHTPGPWKVKDHMIGTETNPNSIGLAYKKDYSTLFTGPYKEDAEQQANAKLIAAAPDLLETLERLLLTSCAAVDPSKDNVYMKKFYEARDKAFEAIKKATL